VRFPAAKAIPLAAAVASWWLWSLQASKPGSNNGLSIGHGANRDVSKAQTKYIQGFSKTWMSWENSTVEKSVESLDLGGTIWYHDGFPHAISSPQKW